MRSRSPSVAEQTTAALLTAALVGALDALVGAIRSPTAGLGFLDVLVAVGLGAALLAPIGVLAGAVLGLLLEGWRRLPVLDAFRARMARPGAYWAPEPEALATLSTVGVGSIFIAWLVFALQPWIDASVARAEHARLAIGLSAAGGALAALVVGVPVQRLLAALFTLQGRVASVGVFFVLGGAFVLGGVAAFFVLSEDLVAAFGWQALATPPVVLLVAIWSIALVRARYDQRPDPRRLRRAAAVLTVAALVGLVASAFAYGRRHTVRGSIEQDTELLAPVVRRYVSLLDRDGDGYAVAFGGGDCDDGDARVFPLAFDQAGDGVDSDCGGGDGTPAIDVREPVARRRASPVLVRPNIVLLTIDALRPDHLGLFGYGRATSPHIDAFGARATVFEDVTAASSRTLYSVPAMLSGLLPSQLEYGEQVLFRSISEDTLTFAEILRGIGYRTAACFGTTHFQRFDSFFQGFDDVRHTGSDEGGRPASIDCAINVLEGSRGSAQPLLLWAHYYDVHAPYLGDGEPSAFGAGRMAAYDTEIRLADAQVARFLERLTALGFDDRTVVILASDHGEAFGEHRTFFHARSLYQEEMRALLLMRVPGVPPRRVRAPVSLIDVMPTVVQLGGAPLPPSLSGWSLLPYARGEDGPMDRPIIGEYLTYGSSMKDLRSLRIGPLKLVWWVREGTFQLFDLASDPGERRDVFDERRDRATWMATRLRGWTARASRPDHRRELVIARNRLDAVPPHMTRRLDVTFGGKVTLLGYDMPPGPFRPGQQVTIDFYYRADREMDESYFIEQRFFVGGSRPVPNFDASHWPILAHYLTNEWRRGEILRDPVVVTLPLDQGRRTYEMRMRLLEERNAARWLRFEGEGGDRGTLDVLEVQVQAP